MQVNKTIIIIGVVAAGVVVIGGLLFYFYASNNTQPNSLGQIVGKNGEEVKVNNIEQVSEINVPSINVISQTDLYVIQYDQNNNNFQIVLNITAADQLASARTSAEADLMDKLGIAQEQLCNLNVVETVLDNGVVTLPVYSFGPTDCGN